MSESPARVRHNSVHIRLDGDENQTVQDEADRLGVSPAVLLRETFFHHQRCEDLLGDIYLYLNWRYVTKQLTTDQKELFADAVDAWTARLNADDPDLRADRVERWWRDA